MEIGRPVPPPKVADLQFDSTCSSPFTTAPSTPLPRALRVGIFYFSAPGSPIRAQSTVVPDQLEFDSCDKPKKGSATDQGVSNEFEFSSRFSEKSFISTADELFHDGKILPLKLPPRLQSPVVGSLPSSLKLPRSPIEQGKKLLRSAFSRRGRDFDPFAVALEETRKAEDRREREAAEPGPRSPSFSSPRANFFTSCSLPSKEEMQDVKPSSAAGSKGSRKKWCLKDFLFKSASEKREKKMDVKNASFQCRKSSVCGSLTTSTAPTHELHNSANRALAEVRQKSPSLPYRRGLLACLGIPAGNKGRLPSSTK